MARLRNIYSSRVERIFMLFPFNISQGSTEHERRSVVRSESDDQNDIGAFTGYVTLRTKATYGIPGVGARKADCLL